LFRRAKGMCDHLHFPFVQYSLLCAPAFHYFLCLSAAVVYGACRYFSANDKGHMAAMAYNWPNEQVDVIVVTDGRSVTPFCLLANALLPILPCLTPFPSSRVLGLGDLGANGMPIPIGKLNLYIAGAGIHPQRVLPVVLDLGTNSQKLIDNPLYLGLQQPRPADPEFFELVDEMMAAFRNRWPNVLIQFEDFSNPHAWQLLTKYRNKHLMFNDDIQSTGTIALAGLLASLRCRNKPLKSIVNERIVCMGAGSAGLGVCETIVRCMVDEGLDYDRARANFWVMDEHGLIGHTRQNM
jgi:hypothetical protein